MGRKHRFYMAKKYYLQQKSVSIHRPATSGNLTISIPRALYENNHGDKEGIVAITLITKWMIIKFNNNYYYSRSMHNW